MIGCKVDSKRLTLWFVYRHRKSWFDGKLEPRPTIRILPCLGNEDNPWNQDSPISSWQLALKDFVVEASLEDQLGSVAQSCFGVQISEQDQRQARLQVEGMGWEAIRKPWVEILHIEPHGILIVVKLVAASQNVFCARQFWWQELIQHVDLCIGGREDSSSLYPVPVLNIGHQVWKYGLTELLWTLGEFSLGEKLGEKAIFIEHNSRRKARRKAGRKARRKLKIVQIKADREYLGEKVSGLGENIFGVRRKARRKAWELGENRKWSDLSDLDLVLSIETLDKVSGTWKNVFWS